MYQVNSERTADCLLTHCPTAPGSAARIFHGSIGAYRKDGMTWTTPPSLWPCTDEYSQVHNSIERGSLLVVYFPGEYFLTIFGTHQLIMLQFEAG